MTGMTRIASLIPDLCLGWPAIVNRYPIGSKMAEVFSTLSHIEGINADIQSTLASLCLTEAGWQRREEEWRHQVDVITIEIEQIERQGGEVLRAAASEAARAALPDDGWRLLDLRHETPTAWQRLVAGTMSNDLEPELVLRLSRRMFAFLPGDRTLSIERLGFLFEAPGADPSAHHIVEFRPVRSSSS